MVRVYGELTALFGHYYETLVFETQQKCKLYQVTLCISVRFTVLLQMYRV